MKPGTCAKCKSTFNLKHMTYVIDLGYLCAMCSTGYFITLTSTATVKEEIEAGVRFVCDTKFGGD